LRAITGQEDLIVIALDQAREVLGELHGDRRVRQRDLAKILEIALRTFQAEQHTVASVGVFDRRGLGPANDIKATAHDDVAFEVAGPAAR